MKSKLQAAVLALAVLLCSVAVIVNFSGNPQMPATVDTPEPPEVIAENYNITSGSPLIANEIIDNLTINGGYPTIQNCTIHNRVIVKGGSPTFIGNVIEDGIHADAKEGPVTITDNTISSKSSFPNIYLQGIHADVSGNEIVGNFSDGIYIYLGVSSASIKQNLIYNCQNGIYLFTGVEQQSEIIGNAIFNNSVGITNRDGEPLIKNNTVTQNVIGIECYRCIAQYNNIYNNSKYNFENPHLSYIDALNNWWGTSYTSEIGQTLFHDDRYRGGINFVPYLNAPNPEAPGLPTEFHSLSTPTSPPTPTPMPSQTQTVPEGFLGLGWLQVAVLAATAASVGLAVGVFVLRRRAKPEG